MKKMFKLLRKYTLQIILVIGLLVAQAYCDLALPDYTSNIINVGIQEGGIESVVPDKISKVEFMKLLNFVTPEEKENIMDKYEEKEEIFELKNISKEEKNKLEEIITLPMAISYYMSQMTDEQIAQAMASGMEQMQSEEMKSMIENKDMLKQVAKVYLKQEHKKIGIDVEKMQIEYIAKAGAKMLGIAGIIMIITILTTLLASRIAANFTADLRRSVVNKVMDFSTAEFNEISTSSLITRCTNDVQQLQILLVMLFRMVLYAPILGAGALTKLVGSTLNSVIAVAILAIIAFIILLLIVAMPKFQKIQTLIDKVNMVAREILTGLPVIRAFATEKHEEKRFDNANEELTKNQLFTRKVMSGLMPYLTIVMNGASIAIIWFASKQIDLGTMQVGDMTAILTYSMQIIMSFLMLSMISIMGPRAVISMKRIAEVLNKEVSIKNKQESEIKKFDENQKGIIEFKDVSFKYPDGDENVLEHISFKATPGTTTAFIGSTGSGKSTLINLIPRFFDVTEGKIIVDGIDIRDADLGDLRSRIGIVPQKGLLFSGTIESNIKFGNEELDEENMKKAAKISCAEDFIEDKENKYNSDISQGGTNVSGGQRQRLAIARAVAINPEIYIFDDSFSALDYKTDSVVRKNLSQETKGATILIVAQRISTIMYADNIIVLNEGKVVGMGTHKELLENCQTYQEIASSQLSQKEIDETLGGEANG